MSEVVERVARALAKSFGDDPDGLTGALLNEDERWWQHYVEHARAAIKAMREPTEEMKFVASSTAMGFSADDVAHGWHLMIDEALK